MPTIERPIDDIHVEIYAPTGGFIFGVSVFGDEFGGDAFRFGFAKFGDTFPSEYDSMQWVDYVADTSDVTYRRGATVDRAQKNAQIGLMSFNLFNRGNPQDDYKIRAGRKVRLRHGNEILFTGKLLKAQGRFTRRGTTFDQTFTIQVADAVKKLGQIKAYGMGGLTEPFESFEERIARILDTYDGPVEMPTGDAYPDKKLCATVYESTLAAHLDVACNSVGASWYIDKLGQLRFVTALTDYVQATFTDGTNTTPITNPFAYYNLDVEYNDQNHVNYIEISNKEIIEDPDNPGEALSKEVNATFSDGASVKANEIIKAELSTTIYDEDSYSGSIAARAAEILADLADPRPSITRVFFNVQENFDAKQLETLHLIDVWLDGTKYTLRVTQISATLVAKQNSWLITLDTIREN